MFQLSSMLRPPKLDGLNNLEQDVTNMANEFSKGRKQWSQLVPQHPLARKCTANLISFQNILRVAEQESAEGFNIAKDVVDIFQQAVDPAAIEDMPHLLDNLESKLGPLVEYAKKLSGDLRDFRKALQDTEEAAKEVANSRISLCDRLFRSSKVRQAQQAAGLQVLRQLLQHVDTIIEIVREQSQYWSQFSSVAVKTRPTNRAAPGNTLTTAEVTEFKKGWFEVQQRYERLRSQFSLLKDAIDPRPL